MTWKRRIQGVVARSNRVFPLSFLLRWPYRLAVSAMIRHCRRFPEVESLYLRHSLAEGEWSPGLSDIDLTVIVDGPSPHSPAFESLVRFWSGVRALERYFPMLGQIEILDRDQFEVWTSATIRGYEAKNWKLVYGRPTLNQRWSGDARRLQEDAINDALATYRTHFLPRFYEREAGDHLGRCLLRRIGNKVIRYATRYGDEAELPRVDTDPGAGPNSILAHLLSRVGERLRRFEAACPRPPAEPAWQEAVQARKSHRVEKDFDLGRLHSHVGSLHGIYRSGKTWIVVFKDEEQTGLLAECLGALRSQLGPREQPELLTHSMLRYLLQVGHPFQYTDFLHYSETLYGAHPLDGIDAPAEETYQRYVYGLLPEVLVFPMSRVLLAPDSPVGLLNHLRLRSQRVLVLKRWLETGALEPSFQENLARAREEFPEVARGLDDAREATIRRGRVSERVFRRFRELTDRLRVAALSYLEAPLPGDQPLGDPRR